MMNAVIAMEGLQRDSQAEWKPKWVATGSSSHPPGLEGIGCQAGALSVHGWAFISTASADLLGTFHPVPCTYSVGATSVASGTIGPTLSRTGEQA